MRVNKKHLQELAQIVKDQLAPARIAHIGFEYDEDHDGDLVLRVTVVLEEEQGRLEPQSVLGLPRHLRDPMEELHINGYPVISFMKPSDIDGAAA